MKSQDVEKVLVDYINDDKYTLSVLISGEWGSGKTFFIKNFMSGLNKKNVYYISLYGIATIMQLNIDIYKLAISRTIDMKLFNKSKPKRLKCLIDIKNKIPNYLSKISIALKILLDYLGLNRDKVKEIIGQKQILNNVILVMDDMERCKVPMDELLGFISNITENNNIKVILIGNEGELLGESPNSEMNDGASESSLYKKYKEKTIGLTLYYVANLENVYANIVENTIKDNDIKRILMSKKQLILDIFNDKNCKNIRTLYFGLLSFEKLYLKIKEILASADMNYGESYTKFFFEDMFRCVMETSITLKDRNKKVTQWEKGELYVQHSGMGAVFSNGLIYKYKFVEEYLSYHIFNEDEIKRTVKEIYVVVQENDQLQNSAYNSLCRWEQLDTDDEINKNLQKLSGEIAKRNLNISYYKNIIFILASLKNEEFPICNIVEIIEEIKCKLRMTPDKIYKESLYISGWTPSEQVLKIYNELAASIYELLDEKWREMRRTQYDFLVNNVWDEKFPGKCRENLTEFMEDRKFLWYVNPIKFMDKLKNAHVGEIYFMLKGLSVIYNINNFDEFLQLDMDNINTLYQEVSNLSTSTGNLSLTKKKALCRFKDLLGRCQNKLQNRYGKENSS